MRACDIELSLDDVLAKVSKPLAKKIEYSVDLIRKSEKLALRLDPENGFYNTFSGGKDSQCLYHLVKMAGVKAKTHMNLTSVDPPEVIRFVKTHYPDVQLIKPKMSIYDMAKKKCILPTRVLRWCCAEFKETSGAGKVTLIGIRQEESARRAKRQEVSTTIKGKRTEETFDQWSEHEEQMVTCVGGKDKVLVSPFVLDGKGRLGVFTDKRHTTLPPLRYRFLAYRLRLLSYGNIQAENKGHTEIPTRKAELAQDYSVANR